MARGTAGTGFTARLTWVRSVRPESLRGGTVRKRDHDRAIGQYGRGIGVARVIGLLILVLAVASWSVVQAWGMDELGQLILGTQFSQ
jgi:hypothetical protein